MARQRRVLIGTQRCWDALTLPETHHVHPPPARRVSNYPHFAVADFCQLFLELLHPSDPETGSAPGGLRYPRLSLFVSHSWICPCRYPHLFLYSRRQISTNPPTPARSLNVPAQGSIRVEHYLPYLFACSYPYAVSADSFNQLCLVHLFQILPCHLYNM